MQTSEYNTIISFLNDIKRNPNSISVGDDSLDNMIASLSTYTESSCNYILTEPTNTDYKTQLDGYGVVLSANTHTYINRPSNIRNVGNEIWISNLESEIVRFDTNFSYAILISLSSSFDNLFFNSFLLLFKPFHNFDISSEALLKALNLAV